ncbi:hypothetical protein [Lacibacter sp.]|uniref:hypothetical protein n=1 Tax=Lacibacter sp. TaxID=1915409 RepID=UPI002B4B3D23|nr:hypothetical protein [Lacibacter sp.]HLP39499.1 hypothetical protein [Lacibacter sp.]
MKIVKIILALLLIYGIGEEYINASKQLFSFFDPGIIVVVLLMLTLCAWLLGSGISKEKFQLKSWNFLKYFGLTFIMFILVAFVSMATFKFPPEIVNVNGVNVDIAEFMNGSKKIIPDEKQRRQYCVCVVTKLTADKDLAEKYQTEFESGKFSNIIIEIQNGANTDKYRLQECAGSVTDVQWTPDFEKGVRRNLMKQLSDLQISSTNDINVYCECLVEEYKKVPINELTSGEFHLSLNGMKIDSICNLKSKLK